MQAIVCHRYGDPDAFRLEDFAPPVPKDNEVLIQVRAASLNALDWHFLKGRPAFTRLFLGLTKPKQNRPGRDVAGRVVAVGPGVTRFKPGDDVFGACRASFSEYACATDAYVTLKPADVSFEHAAALPVAGLTALQGLRDHGRLQPGQRVLVNGATGGVGSFAVQIAKSLGAEVTGVCGTRNVELVRSLGADHVIDYAREDFTRGSQRYDLVFDLVANHPVAACFRVLTPRGLLIAAGAGGSDGHDFIRRFAGTMGGALASRFTSRKVVLFVARVTPADLAVLGEMAQSRKLTPVIDSVHEIRNTSEAIRRLATGHACGKIVVTIPQGGAGAGGS